MKNLLIMGILFANCTFVLAQTTARTEEYCEFTLAGYCIGWPMQYPAGHRTSSFALARSSK